MRRVFVPQIAELLHDLKVSIRTDVAAGAFKLIEEGISEEI
jgi:hypothetical protein